MTSTLRPGRVTATLLGAALLVGTLLIGSTSAWVRSNQLPISISINCAAV